MGGEILFSNMQPYLYLLAYILRKMQCNFHMLCFDEPYHLHVFWEFIAV